MKGLSKGRYDETFAGEDAGPADSFVELSKQNIFNIPFPCKI